MEPYGSGRCPATGPPSSHTPWLWEARSLFWRGSIERLPGLSTDASNQYEEYIDKWWTVVLHKTCYSLNHQEHFVCSVSAKASVLWAILRITFCALLLSQSHWKTRKQKKHLSHRQHVPTHRHTLVCPGPTAVNTSAKGWTLGWASEIKPANRREDKALIRRTRRSRKPLAIDSIYFTMTKQSWTCFKRSASTGSRFRLF